MLEKSLRLMDNHLNHISDKEFMERYISFEANVEPLAKDYILELKEELNLKELMELIENNDDDGVMVFGKYLSYDDAEILGYLIHARTHVFNYNGNNKEFDKILKDHSTKINVKLYRGTQDEEMTQLLSGNALNFYTSYSEDKNISKKFGPNIITILPNNTKALNYWKLMIEYIKQYSDGDIDEDDKELIGFLEEEKEWIFKHDLKLEVVDKEKLLFKQKQ